MMERAIVRFEDVDLGYGRKTVLSGLNFSIEEGEFLGIVGPNGAGKTTLLKAICGILRPLRGKIYRRPGLRFGYVPQRQAVDEAFPLTVLEVVLMGRYGLLGPWRRPRKKDVERALWALRTVGMEGKARSLYRELSGGQKQRVLMARALAGEPEVLLLDEPTADMDLASQKAALELIKELHRKGLTVLLVSHVLEVVADCAPKIALLGEGRMVVGSREEILPLLEKVGESAVLQASESPQAKGIVSGR
ncbi:MAG TPA: metal ABC transporter ATP-binding protein [Armatimonadetes bacterium]|nr:metal ABC transporter ATP-binding protein [Armatimonadota bacterium]